MDELAEAVRDFLENTALLSTLFHNSKASSKDTPLVRGIQQHFFAFDLLRQRGHTRLD